MRYLVLVAALSFSGCQLIPLPEEYQEKIAAIDERDAELRSDQAEIRDQIEEVTRSIGQLQSAPTPDEFQIERLEQQLGGLIARNAEIDERLDSSAEEIANLHAEGRKETAADGLDRAAPVIGSLAGAAGGPGAATLAIGLLGALGAYLRRKEQDA